MSVLINAVCKLKTSFIKNKQQQKLVLVYLNKQLISVYPNLTHGFWKWVGW